MNILITGGAGFIGSHLAEALHELGHNITVIDDLSTGSLDNLSALVNHERFRFIRDTIRNETVMTHLVDHCDVIIHLAAAVGVQLIVDRPVHTIETNIHGSEVVLSLANKFGRKTLVASTSEVYGKSTKTPFNEEDDVTFGSTRFTRWSYACSKMVDEFLALAYHDQYGLPTIVCRFFNTVGPRQTGMYGMVIPRFIRWALAGEPIRVYGTGNQSRCFCHVHDVVEALIRLLGCPKALGEVINIGTDQSISINDLADKVIQMTGSTAGKVYLSYEEAYGRAFDDMQKRMPDLAKVKQLISFQPRRSLDETLMQTIEYEKAKMAKG